MLLRAVTCCYVYKIPLTKRRVSLHILLRVVTCGLFHVKLVRSLQYHINVYYCIDKVDIPIHTLHINESSTVTGVLRTGDIM